MFNEEQIYKISGVVGIKLFDVLFNSLFKNICVTVKKIQYNCMMKTNSAARSQQTQTRLEPNNHQTINYQKYLLARKVSK